MEKNGMSKSVATTKIEKKWKDKKTGEWKSLTIDYAKVNDRLMEFRRDFSRSKISTRSQDDSSGRTKFKAYIWKDKSDYVEMLKHVSDPEVALLTADADASARNTMEGEKDFEKLETIAVGRALAYLGYSVGGEIASAEEMEKFEKFYNDKKAEAKTIAIKNLEDCTTVDQLKQTFSGLGELMRDKDIVKAKDEMKGRLNAKAAN